MAIRLRVVGIYFNTSVEFNGPANVKDIVDRAVASPGAGIQFGYAPGNPIFPGNGTLSVSAFYANYTQNRVSQSSQRTIVADQYYLPEDLSAGISWQYYMFDANGRVLGLKQQPSANPIVPTGGYFDYFDSPDAIVPDGGAVVWRLVKLLLSPSEPNALERSRLIITPPPAKIA